MLFRRVTHHINNQNWFAVFIDFIIVVVGVFIGIQVANWNDERNNRALEEQYLVRLFSDLNGSIDDFNKNFIFDLTRLETQYTVLSSLRNGVLDEKNKIAFSSGLAWAGIHNPQRRRWGTVNELFSTGNITLIQDIELRQELSALGAWYDRNNEIVKASVARIIPLRSELTKKYQILRYSPSTSSVSEVIFEFNDLKQDNEFINTFANLYLESDIVVNFSWASMERFQLLRDKLVPILNVEPEGLPVLANQHLRPWESKTGVKN